MEKFSKQISLTDYGAESEDIARRRKMAELLQQQSMAPIEREPMAGGYVVPTSWTHGLAKLLQVGAAGYQQSQLKGESKALSARAKAEAMDWINAMPQGKPGMAGSPAQSFEPTAADYVDNPNMVAPESGQIDVPAQPGIAATPVDQGALRSWALQGALSGNPNAAAIGSAYAAHLMKQDDPYNLREGEKRFGPNGAVIAENAKTHPLHFANTGSGIQGVNATTGVPVGPTTKVEMTPGQSSNELENRGWGSEFQLNGATVQENAVTGQIRQVVNRPPVTNVHNPAQMPAPVAVITKDGRGVELVKREDSIGRIPANFDEETKRKLAGASAGGKIEGVSETNARIGLPKTIADIAQVNNVVKQMIGDANINADGKIYIPSGGQKPHAGFEGSVGANLQPGFQYIPGTNKANFYALKDQVTSEAFLQAYQNSLKGGGPITEVEGVKGTQALLRARTAQSEVEFVRAMREFEAANNRIAQFAKQKASPVNQQRRSSDGAGRVIDFNALPQ